MLRIKYDVEGFEEEEHTIPLPLPEDVILKVKWVTGIVELA
jgi:hypothetical protein